MRRGGSGNPSEEARPLQSKSKTIRLPVHLGDKSRVRRVALQMSEELGREPTNDELGEEIALPVESFPIKNEFDSPCFARRQLATMI
jgi:hypothetical protein